MLSTSLSTGARADGECLPLISACRDALKAKQVEVDAGNEALKRSIEQTVVVQKELNSATAWYKSPYLWAIVGVAVGGFALRGK